MTAPACNAATECPSFARLTGHTGGRETQPGGRPDESINTVTRMWRTRSTGTRLLVPLAALTALGLAAVAGAQTADTSSAPRVLASNGAVVVMPEIAGLDCAAMSQVLRRIDLSHYRGLDPIPEGHPDRPIFEYEDRLTGKYYYACTLGEHWLGDPGAAFSHGFESQ